MRAAIMQRKIFTRHIENANLTAVHLHKPPFPRQQIRPANLNPLSFPSHNSPNHERRLLPPTTQLRITQLRAVSFTANYPITSGVFYRQSTNQPINQQPPPAI
jgi:hypothetical protein